MMLYSYNGQQPAPLPFRITLPNGFTRTDPTTFTEDELSLAGFTGPYTEPSYDLETQGLMWTGTAYEIISIPPPAPEPNYLLFYDLLIASSVYQSVLQQATQSVELTVYLLAFVAALIDAKTGRPNESAIQASINLVLSVASINESGFLEIEDILKESNLDDIYILR